MEKFIARQSTERSLPSFNGAPDEWPVFFNLYKSTTEACGFTAAENLGRLQRSLKGKARDLVHSLLSLPTNVPTIMRTLEMRYGRPDIIIRNLIGKVQALPPVDDSNLIDFAVAVQNLVTTIQAVDAPGHLYNPQLRADLVARLPSSLRLQWGEKVAQIGPNRVTVADLSTWLSAKAEALSYVAIDSMPSSEPTKTAFRPPTGEALLTAPPPPRARGSSQPRSSTTPTKKCTYCARPHWSDECRTYASLADRRKRLQTLGKCTICLRHNHSSTECRSTRRCYYCQGDHGKHHSSLCPRQRQSAHGTTSPPKRTPETTAVAPAASAAVQPAEPASLVSTNEEVIMQTATANVSNTESSTACTGVARILFDTGSYRTYITADLAQQLQLNPESSEQLSLTTFGSNDIQHMEAATTKLAIHLLNGERQVITATIVPTITGPVTRTRLPSSLVHETLQHLPLADNYTGDARSSTIQVLLGNDFYHDLVLPDRRQIAPSLYLLDTRLGWIVSGRLSTSKDSSINNDLPQQDPVLLSVETAPSTPNAPPLEDFWRMETIGITDSPYDSDDKEAKRLFHESISYQDGRYQVGWPWKANHDLPDNYQLARGRLTTLLRRFRREPETLEKYNHVLQEQLKAGIIEVAPPEVDRSTHRLHYLPHHPVLSPGSATTKLRIVYDGSAKTTSTNNSLNECLYRGPVLLQDLTGILLRFRLQRVAITADIEKAFLQLSLRPPDRDVTRFLWVKDMDNPTAHADNLQELRFARVPFGVISSPFLLAATVQHHLETVNNPVADKLQRDLYVDNVITGTTSSENAVSLYHTAKAAFQSAQMNLRSWNSNDESFLQQVSSGDRDQRVTLKVLGIYWHRLNDTLAIPAPAASSLRSATTKRAILQCVASIYDPLGLLSPVTISAKMFLQDLWHAKLDWDDPLPQQHLDQWTASVDNLAELNTISLPRYIGPPANIDQCTYALLCFCDASGKAYAAAVYLRTTWSTGSTTTLVFCKTRLAPTKKVTIPRLELMATVLGIRCLRFVRAQLHLPLQTQDTLWTDSQCVHGWLRSPQPKAPVFVANRLRTIRTHPATVRYVASSDNPADLPSRGVPTAILKTQKIWFSGPAWLSLPPTEWPTWNITPQPLQDVLPVSTTPSVMFETKLFALDRRAPNPVLTHLRQRVSTLQQLLRVTAWISRFISNSQKRHCRQQGHLSATEIASARFFWEKAIQQHHYADVLERLHAKQQHPLIRQLDLFVSADGLLRCGGRLQHAAVPASATHPVLLPQDDPYTTLVITDLHQKLQHVGTAHTLSQLRRNYWVPHGRQTVKKTLKECRTCRRHQGQHYNMPPMPDLPSERVNRSPPFTYTGVDYFGPLYCTDRPGEGKVWVVLFTCLAIRAIHLELAMDLTADQFLQVLRRFISRRGTPKELLSDNAPHFRVADEVLTTAWSSAVNADQVKTYTATTGIAWRFIPAHAPWMGGVYERMVGQVKQCLRKTLGTARLTSTQLHTILTEAEAIVNTRPLLYVTPDEQHPTLSPADFLQSHTSLGLPSPPSDDQDPDFQPSTTRSTTATDLLNAWKKGQKLLNSFWATWKVAYLTSLRETHRARLTRPSATVPPPCIGDVVQVHDQTSRGSWKLGRITDLTTSRDGQIRSAQVQLANKNFINRPLSALYPLEFSSSSPPSNTRPSEATQPEQQPHRRSTRAAAHRANERLASASLY